MQVRSLMMNLFLVVMVAISAVSFGCGKQEPPPVVEAPTETEELPVLAQNTMYLTNRKEPLRKPNFGFQETDEDKMEEANKDAELEEEVTGD